MVEVSFTSQPGVTGSQITIFPREAKMSAEYNFYSYVYTMHTNFTVFQNKCVRKQGEMALAKKIYPCYYFCDINFPYILQLLQHSAVTQLFVKNWRLLSCKSRSREQFKRKILRMYLQKANKSRIRSRAT